jgi:hypothetical protein
VTHQRHYQLIDQTVRIFFFKITYWIHIPYDIVIWNRLIDITID